MTDRTSTKDDSKMVLEDMIGNDWDGLAAARKNRLLKNMQTDENGFWALVQYFFWEETM